MGERLDPVKNPKPTNSAIEVKPNAEVEIKTSESSPGKLREMRWREAQAIQRGRQSAEGGPPASEADKEAYRKFYESQTTTNGCSVPTAGSAPAGSYRAGWRDNPAVVKACNEHDVDYGRGGGPIRRLIADAKLGLKIAAAGEPGRALITYSGVRVGGMFFFSYRMKQLPIPEGK